MPNDQPGFKKMPVPGKDELRPNARDCTPEKGALSYVKPVTNVMDFGAPRDSLVDWRGTTSPASPQFRAGVPMGVNPSIKPEEQSVRTQPGIVAGERSKKTIETKNKKGYGT